MRSLGGFVLLAGIGVGLFVYLPTPVDNTTSLVEANRVSHEDSQPAPVASRLTAFAPNVPLPTVAVRARGITMPKPTFAVARPGDLSVTTTAQKGGLNGWQSVVATNGGVEATPASLQPTDPNSRYELVVELQRNLKRLGCYWGRVDGSWGPGSKDAMRTFTERVNAALPTDQPDYVQLTLLKGHSGRTCGASATVADAPSAGSEQVATAEPDALPWKSTGQPVFKPIANSVISSAPLPGRMAIGGPKALPPVDQNYNAASPYTAQPNVATAALEPNHEPPAAAPAPTTTRKKTSSSTKRRHRRDGPGTPRYNLMLSLGGVY